MNPNHYFSRCAGWTTLKNCIVVSDPNRPRMITMDRWGEVVFMAADGHHTIEQFVEYMGKQYPQGEPAGLREQIYGMIDALVSDGIVAVHDLPKTLPLYYAVDRFSIPKETVRDLMEADGLIKPGHMGTTGQPEPRDP